MINRYQAQLTGLRRLLVLDPEYFKAFQATPAGFWQAFRVLPFTLTVQIINSLLLYFGPPAPDETPMTLASVLKHLAIDTLAIAVIWALYPLVVVYLSRLFGVGKNYFRYMVPYLWFTGLLPVVSLPCALLGWAGVLPGGQAEALMFFIDLIALGYTWFLAWKGLAVSAGTAAGLMVLDLTLSAVVTEAAFKLYTIALPF